MLECSLVLEEQILCGRYPFCQESKSALIWSSILVSGSYSKIHDSSRDHTTKEILLIGDSIKKIKTLGFSHTFLILNNGLISQDCWLVRCFRQGLPERYSSSTVLCLSKMICASENLELGITNVLGLTWNLAEEVETLTELWEGTDTIYWQQSSVAKSL